LVLILYLCCRFEAFPGAPGIHGGPMMVSRALWLLQLPKMVPCKVFMMVERVLQGLVTIIGPFSLSSCTLLHPRTLVTIVGHMIMIAIYKECATSTHSVVEFRPWPPHILLMIDQPCKPQL